MAIWRISTCASVWTSQYRGGFSRESGSTSSAVSENRRWKLRRCASRCACHSSLDRTRSSHAATRSSSSCRKIPSPRSSVATVQTGRGERVSGASLRGTSPTRSRASMRVKPTSALTFRSRSTASTRVISSGSRGPRSRTDSVRPLSGPPNGRRGRASAGTAIPGRAGRPDPRRGAAPPAPPASAAAPGPP